MQNLPYLTRHLLRYCEQQMDVWRQEALEKYAYELAYYRWTSSPEEVVKSAEDAQGLIPPANHYGTYRRVMNLWESYVQDGLRASGFN
jgi:hypothetical protein